MSFFDDLLDAAANERLARHAGLAMDAAPDMNGLSPDQEAQARDLAVRSGLPLDIVRADPRPAVEDLTRARRDQILARSPVLSAYAQDPHNAALVRDDLEALSVLEHVARRIGGGAVETVGSLVQFPAIAWADIDAGPHLQRQSLLSALDQIDQGVSFEAVSRETLYPQWGGLFLAVKAKKYAKLIKAGKFDEAQAIRAELAAEEAAAPPPVDPREMAFYKVGADIADSSRKPGGMFYGDLRYKGSFLLDEIPSGIGSTIPFLIGGWASKVLMGSTGATMATTASLGAGVNSATVFDDALASGADLDTAYRAAEKGAVVGLGEAIPIGNILSRADRVTGRSIRQILTHTALGAGEEAAQEALNQYGNNLIARQHYDPDRGLSTGVAHAAGVGGSVGAIISGLLSSVAHVRSRRGTSVAGGPSSDLEQQIVPVLEADLQAIFADDGATAFTELVDRGRETKTAARSPAAMEEILGQPLALGDKVFSMPADGLLELYQSGVIDEQTLEALKVRPDDITAAALSGGDVEIAGAALAVRLMAMDKAKAGAVIAHLRFSPEAMTKAEAEAWRVDPAREAEIAAFQAEMEAMEKAAEGGGDAMEPDARASVWGTIVADVTADLKATGLYKEADARAQAQVVAARTVLRAEQRGMNPLDLWAEERAKIEGPEAKPPKKMLPFGGDDLTLWQELGEPAITPEISAAIRRQAGPIRLQMGDEKAGLVHIEKRHGEQARGLGYADAREMVADITANFDAIYQGNGRTLILAKRTPTRGQAYVQLEPSEEGDFYDVKTATPSRVDQFKNKTPLWERTGPSAPPNQVGTVNPSIQSGENILSKDGDDLKQSARGSYTPASNTMSKGLRDGAEGGDVPFELWQDQPVVTIRGDELAPADADLVTLRKAAQDYWNIHHKPEVDKKGNVIKRVFIVHPQLGEIDFTTKGRGKFFNTSANHLKLRMVPKLQEIVEGARVVGEPIKNYKERPYDNIKQYYWLENNVEILGHIYGVGIQVFEDHKGHKFYNLTADLGEKNGPQITRHKDEGNGPSEEGSPSYEQTIAQDGDGINLTQRAEALAGEVSDLMGSLDAVRGMSDAQLDHALGLARGKRAWAPYAKQTPLRDGDIAAMVREADQTGRDLDDVAADWAERLALMVEGDAESKGLREDAEGGDVPFELWQSTTPRGGAWSSLAGDVTSFTQDIERVLKHGPNRGASARVGETPLIFNRLGVKRRDLRMHETKIEKILKQDHPEISPEQLGRAAALLSDPVMVMESGTQSGAFVAVLDDVDANGDFLIAAIHPSDGTVQFDKLASVYGKQRVNPQGASAKDWIARNINNGSVLYLNTKKAPELSRAARVYIPAVQKIRSQNPNMLTERHLVKARKSQPQVCQRGQSPRGSYTPATNTIRLFQSANMSTFVHESGHQWLFQMADDLGDARLLPEARAQIVEDLGAVLKHLGVKGVDPTTATPQQIKAALSVEQHEIFARTVEAYIREGKAPSKELRRAFRRLASWLVQIYKSMRGLDVEMTAEIRGVMDRLLANETALAAERQGREVTIAPEIWRAATEAERAKLGAVLNEAKDEAFTKVWAAQTASEARRRKKAYQAERTAVRESLAPKIAERPEYRALEAVRQVPLDRVALNEAFGQGIVPHLPHKSSVIEGGANPEVVADMLGFENAAELIAALRAAKAKPQEIALKEAVEAEMQARHKDLRDPVALAEEARQALDYSAVFAETQKIVRRLAGEQAEAVARRSVAQEGAGKATDRANAVKGAELEGVFPIQADAAARAAGETVVAKAERKAAAQERAVSGTAKAQAEGINRVLREMDGPMIEEAAGRLIAGTLLTKLSPNRHRVAAQTAGRKAMVAAAKRDWATVQAQLSRQYMAQVLEIKARAAVADKTKIMARFKAFDKPDKKLATGTDIDFINAGRVILARFGLGRKGAEIDQAAWLEKLAEQDPIQAQEFKEMINGLTATAKPWQELTVQELRDLDAGLNALREMGRRAKAMEIEGKAIEFSEIEAETSAQFEAAGRLPEVMAQGHIVTEAEGRRSRLLGLTAHLKRVESWAEGMDNGDLIGGAVNKYLYRPVQESVYRYKDARRDLMPQLKAIIDPIKDDLSKPMTIKAQELSADTVFSNKGQIFAILLNMGNQGNLTKLVAGYGWGKVLDNGAVDTSRLFAFLHRLSAEGVIDGTHLQAAQGILDLYDTTKGPAQKAHKRMYGYEFEEVSASAIDIPGLGRLKGGYYPVFYDGDHPANARSAQHAAADDLSALGSASGALSPSGGKGFTLSRVAYTGPLALDLAKMPRQLDAVLRFTHIEPAVRDAARLVRRPGYSEVINRASPGAVDNVIVPWLSRAVRQTVETPSAGGRNNLDPLWRTLRKRAGLQLMMGNVVNTLQQVTGFAPSTLHVGAASVGRGIVQSTLHPKEMTQAIMARSAFMRDRLDGSANEMAHELDAIFADRNVLQKGEAWAMKHGYFAQQYLQNFMDKAIWYGAYEEAISAGKSEAEAVLSGDHAVRTTQGSFAPEDISNAESGPAFVRLFTQFYRYFNAQANLLMAQLGIASRTMSPADFAKRAAWIYMVGFAIPAVGAEIIAQAARGTLGDDDDDGIADDLVDVFLLSQLRYAAAFVPSGGAVANLVLGQFTTRPYDDRLTLSPGVGLLEGGARVGKFGSDLVSGKMDRLPMIASDLIAVVSGVPSRAVAKPISYAINVAEGDSQPEHLGNVVSGVLTGRDGTE